MTSHKPRQPAGRFLGPTGIRYKPLRDLPVVRDEQDLVDRIREARTLRDEPEMIGPAILTSYAEVNQRISTQQHLADVAAAMETRPLLSLEDRLKDIERRAKFAHVDLSNELHIMRRDIDRAKAGGRKPPKRVIERAQNLESLLDGVELLPLERAA